MYVQYISCNTNNHTFSSYINFLIGYMLIPWGRRRLTERLNANSCGFSNPSCTLELSNNYGQPISVQTKTDAYR